MLNKQKIIITIIFLIISFLLFFIFQYKKNLVKEKNIFSEVDFGYTYDRGHLEINYPLFISKIEYSFLDEFIEKVNNDNTILNKVITINNIDSNDFLLISYITSKIDFEYYTLEFNEYSDEYYGIFDSLINSKKIIELDIFFNTKLSGENTLIKTLNKIKELNNIEWQYFTIGGNEDFKNSYKIGKEEIDILHSMSLYGLYIHVNVIDNKELLNQIEKFVISSKFAEYSLFGKFNKGAGKNGIYKILDNGSEIKISEQKNYIFFAYYFILLLLLFGQSIICV